MRRPLMLRCVFFFFLNDPATTEIYPLPLPDALPICMPGAPGPVGDIRGARVLCLLGDSITTDHISPAGAIRKTSPAGQRSEEHTSELQSRLHLVCRLLLEKKKKTTIDTHIHAIATRP